MSKTKISLYDADPGNNTDIDGINLAEGMAPGLVNNAIRELMAQLKDFQVGSAGDSLTVGGNLVVTGTATVSGRTVDAFPTGTKMLFQQTTAPVGWTKDVTNDDKALRIVSGTAGSGGTLSLSSFATQTIGDTTLTTAQIPVHSHSFSGSTGDVNLNHSHGVTDPSHTHTQDGNIGALFLYSGGGGNPGIGQPLQANVNVTSATTGISIQNALGNHAHSVSGSIGNEGSGNSHTHTLDLDIAYVDVIVATKD